MKISDKLKQQLKIFESIAGAKRPEYLLGLIDSTKTSIAMAEMVEAGIPEELLDAVLSQMLLEAVSGNAKNN